MSAVDNHKALKAAGWMFELDASQHQTKGSFDLLPSDSVPAVKVSPSQKWSEHRPSWVSPGPPSCSFHS